MTVSRNKDMPALRVPKGHVRKKVTRKPRVKYYVHWIYPTIFVFILAFFISIFLYQSAKTISIQYRIGKLKQQKIRLLKDQKALSLNIEKLESLPRIEKIACTELKMVYPSKRYVLNVASETSTAMSSERVLASR